MRGLSLLALFLALIAIPAAEAQPLNDDIANATVLSEPFPIEASGTTVGATTAADDPSCLGNRSNTVWFRFTPDRDMSIESVLGAEAGSVLCAYSGSRGALTELAATESNTEVPVTLDVTAGTTYWLMVASCPATTSCGPSTGGVGTFAMDFIEVVPAPPPNDDFNTPTVVTDPLPFTATEFQGRATTDGDDPFPDCSLSADPEVDRNTVWFSYLPRSSRTVTVTLEGTAYDAGICVYAGNQGAFVEIASGANGVEFRPTPDMTYHFLVTSTAVSDSSSDLLHIRFDAGPPLPLPPNDNAENATALNDPLPTTVDQETEG